MAFAAVSCLIETLEDLLRFIFLAVEIKELQIKIEDEDPSDNFIRASVQNAAEFMLMPKPLLLRMKLSSFTQKHPILSVITEEISKFRKVLLFILTILEISASTTHNDEKMQYLERRLTELAYKMGDMIEETIIDHSISLKAFHFISASVNKDPMVLREEHSFMSQVSDMFDKTYLLHVSLQQTLSEISFIKEEMEMIYDGTPIVNADLQSGQTSVVADSLQHMTTKKDQVFYANDGFMSILDRVIRDSCPLELVAIVGMGGIGKTTLAQRIFDYPLTCHHFYIRAWVVVSQVYRVRDILIGILSCISQINDEICGKNIGQLTEMLWRSLKGKRFFIVLDNIWSTKVWDDVKRCFPDDKNGSRIILTTRQMEVANYVSPRQPPHYVNLLDIDQSWKLLQWKVFGEESCPDELEDVGRRIAKQCQGLPLVIVVIAGVLCEIKRTRDCWQGIAESVNAVVSSDPEQCLEILALSYNHLPNHLKACFLYLGAFPEDCEIEAQKLIRLWVSEGLLDKKLDTIVSSHSFVDPLIEHSKSTLELDGEGFLEQILDPDFSCNSLSSYSFVDPLIEHSKSTLKLDSDGFLEQILDPDFSCNSLFSYSSVDHLIEQSKSTLELDAETYLKDLVSRNLVLVGKRTFSGEIRTCRMHELMQEMCRREAQKENFMHVIRMGSEAYSDSIINQRRLSLQSSSWGNLHSLPSLELVRSFICFSLGSGKIPDTLFTQLGFKLLRVLDIIFLPFQSFPDLILQLIHLKYLAFTATFELPVSISELKNLQTLIIHGPWIPDEFGDNPILLLEYWDMPRLRSVHTTVACYLRNPFILKKDLCTPLFPQHLQCLSSIMFSSCSQEVFSLMPNIKKLGIFESEEDYITDVSSNWLRSLVHLNHLEELKCSFHAQNRSPRNNLHWLFPPSLKKLTLSCSYVPWESMTPVAVLPKLEVLKLKNHAFLGTKWEPSEEGFRCLKHLLIENHDLVHLEATRIHFPHLEHLALRSCKSFEEIHFGIVEIPALQLIELHYCSESAEDSAKEIQEQIDDLNVDIRTDRRS